MGNLIVSLCIFVILFLIQFFYFFLPTKKKIEKVIELFPKEHLKYVNNDNVVQIEASAGSDKYKSICASINEYIAKNHDSIDLGEMKDIADRVSDKEFEEATAKTAFPMYTGLMGTYLGIGWGLIVLLGNMSGNADRTFDAVAIYGFIEGVVVAMLTSLIGLFLTTYNNNLAAKSASELEKGKDSFIAFLQTKILPQLPSTLVQSLKTQLQTSIGSLGSTIGELNHTVKSLNSELRSTFQGITQEFGENLAKNLNSIQDTVTLLTQSAGQYAENLKIQDNILNTLNSSAFASVLKKIVSTVGRCDTVADSIGKIENSAEEVLSLQKNSEVIQTSLIALQQALMESQERYNGDLIKLHEDLCDITIKAQERLNDLSQQPNQLFEYVKNMLGQFKKLEEFVEKVTVEEFSSNTNRIEYINKQLRALEDTGKTIEDYMEHTAVYLKSNIDARKEEIKESAEEFINSWNNFFSALVVRDAENPLSYLRQIEAVSEKLNQIQAAISGSSKQDALILEQLQNISASCNKLCNKKREKGDGHESENILESGRNTLFKKMFGHRRKKR